LAEVVIAIDLVDTQEGLELDAFREETFEKRREAMEAVWFRLDREGEGDGGVVVVLEIGELPATLFGLSEMSGGGSVLEDGGTAGRCVRAAAGFRIGLGWRL